MIYTTDWGDINEVLKTKTKIHKIVAVGDQFLDNENCYPDSAIFKHHCFQLKQACC